jgi:glycosyl transferase family 2
MGLWNSYRLRLERKRRRVRSLRKRQEMQSVSNRTDNVMPDDILLFSTVRNEKIRLPYFLQYYRQQGVDHFFFVDNNSTDGSGEYLADQSDVSLWHTAHSYKKSKFGVDWLNGLKSAYASGHWVLVVDVDEFFIYPFCDKRPLRALTDWLDASSVRSFGTVLLDLYPKGKIEDAVYQEGNNPIDLAHYFDSGNYFVERNRKYGNLWIQGGPRQRVFFKDAPQDAPALNKIPLVKWNRSNVYVSSTHNLLPRGLNLVYDEWGGEKACGCLLHTKFLNLFSQKAVEEVRRRQHYAASREYKSYIRGLNSELDLWTDKSVRYENWQQLDELGLMCKGNWV